MSRIIIRSYPDLASCTQAFVNALKEAITAPADTAQGIMISGGSTPLEAYQELTANPVKADASVRLIFADDRHVPHSSPDCNYFHVAPMAAALGIANENVFRVRDDLELDAASAAYGEAIDTFFDDDGFIPIGFLGMGTDGHTASLFTTNDADRLDCTTLPVRDKGGFNRVSVSSAVLARVRRLIFLVPGESKVPMLRTLLSDPDSIPAGRAVDGHPSVEIWTDVPAEQLRQRAVGSN